MEEVKEQSRTFLKESFTKELSTVEKAEMLVKKLEEQNKLYEELIQRQEKAKVEDMLAGRSTQTPQAQPGRKRTPIEYAKAFMKGEVKLDQEEPDIV